MPINPLTVPADNPSRMYSIKLITVPPVHSLIASVIRFSGSMDSFKGTQIIGLFLTHPVFQQCPFGQWLCFFKRYFPAFTSIKTSPSCVLIGYAPLFSTDILIIGRLLTDTPINSAFPVIRRAHRKTEEKTTAVTRTMSAAFILISFLGNAGVEPATSAL